MGLPDEEVSLKKDRKTKKNKIHPRDLDGSYNNRKALRRIYKMRIKGRKSGKREDGAFWNYNELLVFDFEECEESQPKAKPRGGYKRR